MKNVSRSLLGGSLGIFVAGACLLIAGIIFSDKIIDIFTPTIVGVLSVFLIGGGGFLIVVAILSALFKKGLRI